MYFSRTYHKQGPNFSQFNCKDYKLLLLKAPIINSLIEFNGIFVKIMSMSDGSKKDGKAKAGENTEMRILELKNRLEPNSTADLQRKELDEMMSSESPESEDEDATEFFEIDQTDINLTTPEPVPKEPTVTKTNTEVSRSQTPVLNGVPEQDDPTVTVTKTNTEVTRTEVTQLKEKKLPSRPDSMEADADQDHTELATQIGIELESELPQSPAQHVPESEDITQMTQLDLYDEDGEYEYEEIEEDDQDQFSSFGYINEKKSKLKQEQEEDEEIYSYAHPMKRLQGGVIELATFIGLSILGNKEQLIIQTEKVYFLIIDTLKKQPELTDQQLDLILMASFGFLALNLVNILCLILFKRSLGKVLTNTMILRLDNNEPGLGIIFVREFIYRPLSYLVLIGFITLFTDEHNRSLHDKLSYTKLVDRI